MKTEQQKKAAVIKILALVYFETGQEITGELAAFWRSNLRGLNMDLCLRLAEGFGRVKTYGEPRFQDFFLAYKALEAEYIRMRRPYNPWVAPSDDHVPQRIGELIRRPERRLLAQ